jgi:hypothetical protein
MEWIVSREQFGGGKTSYFLFKVGENKKILHKKGNGRKCVSYLTLKIDVHNNL